MTHDLYDARLEPGDALMLQFESPDTAFHTLKIAILDGGARGRPVTLEELVTHVPAYLGVSPRLTQRVERRSYWHWRWVDDTSFDIRDHVEEVTVNGPEGLDRLCGELAARKIDRTRPLWRITLVHGLPDGKQAVVAQVHHAIMDGSAAMNVFAAVTSKQAGVPPEPRERVLPTTPRKPAYPRRLLGLLVAWVQLFRRTRSFGPTKNVPRRFMRRTRFNPTGSGATRLCGSRPISVSDLKELAGFLGTNVNGAVHATLAVAMREYLIAAGDQPKHPVVVNYGVAEDPSSDRCDGNKLATARLWLHVDDPDPLSAARRTAMSTTESVALRRHRGFEFQRYATEYAWTMPAFRNLFVDLPPFTPVHVLSAYVSGPKKTRWFGDVEATGFLSYAISVAPTDLSITAYRYAGQLWLGAVVTPEAMPDPENFLSHFEKALSNLLALVHGPAGAQPA